MLTILFTAVWVLVAGYYAIAAVYAIGNWISPPRRRS